MEWYQRIPLWKDVPPEQWETYRWQMSNRIETVEKLRQVIKMTPSEDQVMSFVVSVTWSSLP